MGHELRGRWALDPEVTFLNHGSFGACPREVLEAARAMRERIEREPVRFFVGELEKLYDEARGEIAAFVGADADDLAFVPNATAGVSTVLRSLDFAPGEELLTTDHAYNACKNALDHAAARAGAKVVVARVPFPISGPDAVVEAVLAAVTPRTKIALIDQVTSPTALVFPVDRIVSALAERGVDTIVDAAHTPGMLPMHVDAVGAAYTTGNFHKWTCAPKGAAFLHVRRDRQAGVRPLAISHGANSPRVDRSRFRLEFDWIGTVDPTAFLCVPDALRFLAALVPGGIPELMARGHAAAVKARRAVCAAVGIDPPSPDEMLGSMASVPVSAAADVSGDQSPFDPLQEALFRDFRIEIPVFPWPAPPARLLRVSTPIYVTDSDVQRLVEALRALEVTRG
ncbi:Cysteine desulfurase [Minicystis rosea]|nr:Cysteine desulfurase [Minicystis rosea]